MAKIEVKNVSKRFGPVMAVNDVTLTFEENRIYGLLGRNGTSFQELFPVSSQSWSGSSLCSLRRGWLAIC